MIQNIKGTMVAIKRYSMISTVRRTTGEKLDLGATTPQSSAATLTAAAAPAAATT